MKLTLQLVVVVLNAPRKFRNNQFKFTLFAIIIYKVGDTRFHLGRHALIQHNFFHEIRTPTESKHARIVVIGQQQIQKPMKLSQIEKRIPQTLTYSKDVIQKAENMLVEVAGPDQRVAKNIRPGHCTKKFIPGVLG